MKRRPGYEMNPWWRRRTIVVPPETPDEWVRLVAWELWMGMTIFLLIVIGLWLISSAPERIVPVRDLSPCWADPPAPPPCARTLYRGAMNLMFSVFTGVVMWSVAAWLLWQLWSVAEPHPIADDFLRLLNDSFSRDWRNPLTWPWSRVWWAYGFTGVGAALTAGVVAVMLWMVIRR
ncbi:MAG TPA: hypothetical protein VJ691_10805 [Vicinamibacterales bacterium]|nr:hypothetical protein [Vicinamibacterales bacterium]